MVADRKRFEVEIPKGINSYRTLLW
jgi:hypothetical protein